MCIHNEDKEAEICVDEVSGVFFPFFFPFFFFFLVVVVFLFLCLSFSVNFPEVVTLVLTKSASCWGVQSVTDLAKFQV